jgi:hypothetical protein
MAPDEELLRAYDNVVTTLWYASEREFRCAEVAYVMSSAHIMHIDERVLPDHDRWYCLRMVELAYVCGFIDRVPLVDKSRPRPLLRIIGMLRAMLPQMDAAVRGAMARVAAGSPAPAPAAATKRAAPDPVPDAPPATRAAGAAAAAAAPMAVRRSRLRHHYAEPDADNMERLLAAHCIDCVYHINDAWPDAAQRAELAAIADE